MSAPIFSRILVASTLQAFALVLISPLDQPYAGSPLHGAKAAGMGTAFVGIADDPSAILHNPAGLATVKGTNVYSGGTVVMISSDFEAPTGDSESTEFQIFFPPHLYASSDFNTRDMVFGLGILSPFGVGGRKWSDQGLTRYAGTETTIATLSANPTFSWQVRPWLSLGVGFYYMYAQNTAKRNVDQSAFQAADAKLSLDAKGGGWGYDLGVLLFPGEKFSVGVAYRSAVKVDQNGDVTLKNIAPDLQPYFGGDTFKTGVDSSLEFPRVASLGFAYRPTQSLTFGLDVEWLGWSSFDKMHLDFDDEVPEAGFSDDFIDFQYNNVWQVKAGLDYRLNSSLSLRCGYTYSSKQVPETTLNPGNPDSDQHGLSVGLGYRRGKIVLDGFYTADFFQTRRVENDILSGKYDSFIHFIGLSVGYSF